MVEVENLNKIYSVGNKQVQVLEGVTFRIQKGELLLLRGVSGSGKTTLLSIMAGMEKPSSGKVLIDSEPISKLPDIHLSHFRAQKIGMVFQHFNLIENLTLLDNVMVPLVANRVGLKEAKEMALGALKSAKIEHKKDAYPNRLSGGEKQRGAIARAIVAKPSLLLCDEPTANLDGKNSQSFIEQLLQMHKEGQTIVIATHDPIFETLTCKHRVIDLKNGKIV